MTSSETYALSPTLSIRYRGLAINIAFAGVSYVKSGQGAKLHRKNAMKPRNIAVSVPAWYTNPPPDGVAVDRGGGAGVLVLVGSARLVLDGAPVLLLSWKSQPCGYLGQYALCPKCSLKLGPYYGIKNASIQCSDIDTVGCACCVTSSRAFLPAESVLFDANGRSASKTVMIFQLLPSCIDLHNPITHSSSQLPACGHPSVQRIMILPDKPSPWQ